MGFNNASFSAQIGGRFFPFRALEVDIVSDSTPEMGGRFEDILAGLEAIVASLESQELDLEQSIQAFEQGVALARECHRRLDDAERRVEVLRRGPDGKPTTEAFDDREGA